MCSDLDAMIQLNLFFLLLFLFFETDTVVTWLRVLFTEILHGEKLFCFANFREFFSLEFSMVRELAVVSYKKKNSRMTR